jgi:hypothetical protein
VTVIATVVIVATVATLITGRFVDSTVEITATSSDTAYPAGALVSAGDDADRSVRWRSDGQTVGAAVTTTWSSPHPVGRIEARAPADPTLAIRDAYLTFGDGSSLVARPDAAGDIVFAFTERRVDRATLTVTAAREGATTVGLSSLRFAADDSVPSSDTEAGLPSLSASASTADATPLVDGAAMLSDGGTGAVWRSGAESQPWVQLNWSQPREVSSIQIYGAPDVPGTVVSGRLEFSDGSVIPTAGVEPTAGNPSTIAFMPRVATFVRYAMETDGPVALREVAVFQRGRTPPSPRAGPGLAVTPPTAPDCAVPAVPNTDRARLRLICPQPGVAIDDTVRVVVAAPAATTVTATAWAEWTDGDRAGGETTVGQATTADSGYAVLDLDARRLLRGPATIRVAAGGIDEPLYVQLFNPHGVVDDARPIPQANGMTLAWSDDFRTPVSISRTGKDATYAATKPSVDGPSEFGEAIFADPAWGTSNVGVVGDDYLRIRVTGRPPDITDPFGWNRNHLGGMVSSAALGGSGFSAQYGYFEARILGAPGRGTWPAFWALSTGSIAERGASTGEVDVVELYGHNTVGSCHSIHNWAGGDDKQVDCTDDNGISDWALDWHIYGARITPTGTTFYVDGTEVSTLQGLINTNQPYYFLLNLAMGGGWPIDISSTQDVADVYVDYVRVYT